MKTGSIWIEALLVISILLIVGLFALRVVYGQDWLAWEYQMVKTRGISRGAWDMVKISGFSVAFLTYLVIKILGKRRKAAVISKLPIE